MITKEQLADMLIERLNEISRTDPVAMTKLVSARVPCNEEMASHSSVQVDCSTEHPTVGLLGILNGLVGTIGSGPKASWGLITICIDEGVVKRFERTT